MSRFSFPYRIPVLLVSFCFVALCAITAASLFAQQRGINRLLRENVQSQRAAVELEECLLDLIALEDDRVEAVAVLHDRARQRLDHLVDSANSPEEVALREQMESAFAEYLLRWRALPAASDPKHDAARREATRFLESDVLRPCQEFEHLNAGRIDESTHHHELVLRQLAWGMGVVGLFGGVAGVALGYGVARGLARSIRRLHVQLRDAAGKLGPAGPEIVLTGDGDFAPLHTQLDYLTDAIEAVVRELQAREYEILRAEQLAAVGQLAAGVAHEIRNPLTSIKMLVQAAQSDGDGVSVEDLRVIEGEVRRMERSLNTFLNFARPPQAQRTSVPIGPLVADVCGLIDPRAEKQRVAVSTEMPNAGLSVTADPEQLRQVVVNLCLNALDAMPTGGKLNLAIRPLGNGVELEVADTGPGIAAVVQPKLFQPFASTKETGLGLGLVISKRIVEDHGGSIRGTNRAGGGASFFVRLPAGGVDADRVGS